MPTTAADQEHQFLLEESSQQAVLQLLEPSSSENTNSGLFEYLAYGRSGEAAGYSREQGS